MRQDDEWFESIYKEFYPDIYRFAFSYVKRKEVAEDIAQDIFLGFYFHAPKNDKNLKSFLLKKTMNKCLDVIRKEKRISEAQRRYETIRSLDEKITEHSDRKDLILLSLSKITKIYEEPIRLFYYGGMTIKEIASFLHISQETVKKRLQRGRKFLKVQLEGENEK